jgi:hypothetical protein
VFLHHFVLEGLLLFANYLDAPLILSALLLLLVVELLLLSVCFNSGIGVYQLLLLSLHVLLLLLVSLYLHFGLLSNVLPILLTVTPLLHLLFGVYWCFLIIF